MATRQQQRSHGCSAALALPCVLACAISFAQAQDDRSRDKAVIQPRAAAGSKPQAAVKAETTRPVDKPARPADPSLVKPRTANVAGPQASVKGESATAIKKDAVRADGAVTRPRANDATTRPRAADAASPPAAARSPSTAAIRVWRLPSTLPASAASAAAESPPTHASPEVAARFHTRQLADVLKQHGFVGDVQADTRVGLPNAILNDRARLDAVLVDLRKLHPPTGNWTVRQKRLPETNDQETSDALDALRSAGALDQLTAGELLADAANRQRRERQCVAASRAMDAQEANVRVIGGGADPGAPHGSPAFWQALERSNAGAAAAYRRAAETYAAACLDTQWQALTPAQRQGMPAVLGFLHVDGVAECMGTRVAVDRFLTARHCLYRYDRNIGWERAPMQRLHVTLAGEPGTAFATEEIDCDGPQPDAQCSLIDAANPLASDHLLLRIKARTGSALPPMPALRVDRAAVQQMLVVPGRSPWITGRALAPKDPVYVTVSDLGGCMIATNREGCLVNSCQSEAGFSGAPMFARRKVDELVLVGIFLGSTAHNPYRQCQARDRNFGAVLPFSVEAALR